MGAIDNLDYPIGKLKGLASLFTGEGEMDSDEMFGINWILVDIAKELEAVKKQIYHEKNEKINP